MKANIRKNKHFKVFAIIIAIVVLIAGGCTWYVNDYYHVTDKDAAMLETADVKIIETSTGCLYDGPGNDTALIFYPGAKVEDIAYASILKELASNGIDCFLVHMPANLAMFGINRADKIMQEYSYNHWYLAGHSLGGAMAASYAYKNSDKLDGLIFLAAYSAKDLSDKDLKVLSVYGSNDKVLKMNKVESGRKYMPDSYDEYCIDGGNHAGYADYGIQKGDGEALITHEIQQKITAQKILDFIAQ